MSVRTDSTASAASAAAAAAAAAMATPSPRLSGKSADEQSQQLHGAVDTGARYLNLRPVLAYAQSAAAADGMIVIKCRCGDTVRRIPILNRELTYNELCIMMHRLFRPQLSDSMDNMVLRYRDDDGDLISLTDDLDIAHAITLSPVVRVVVYDTETMPLAGGGVAAGKCVDAPALKATLSRIQSELNAIIARLDLGNNVSAVPGGDEVPSVSAADRASTPGEISTALSSRPLNTAEMAEFLDAPMLAKRNSDLPSPTTTPSLQQSVQSPVVVQQSQPRDSGVYYGTVQVSSSSPIGADFTQQSSNNAPYNPYTLQQHHQQQHQQQNSSHLSIHQPSYATPSYITPPNQQMQERHTYLPPGGVAELSMPRIYPGNWQRPK